MSTVATPFELHVSDEVLVDLRTRLTRVRRSISRACSPRVAAHTPPRPAQAPSK